MRDFRETGQLGLNGGEVGALDEQLAAFALFPSFAHGDGGVAGVLAESKGAALGHAHFAEDEGLFYEVGLDHALARLGIGLGAEDDGFFGRLGEFDEFGIDFEAAVLWVDAIGGGVGRTLDEDDVLLEAVDGDGIADVGPETAFGIEGVRIKDLVIADKDAGAVAD